MTKYESIETNELDETGWRSVPAAEDLQVKHAVAPGAAPVWAIFACVVILGPINFTLYKILYTSYGDACSSSAASSSAASSSSSCAFFVANGVNALYVIIGGVGQKSYCNFGTHLTSPLVLPPALQLSAWRGGISAETRSTPQFKFIVMGFLDSMAGFLSAMGAVHTSGAAQQLFNQALIPTTMLFSWLFLRRHSTLLQIVGACIIGVGVYIVLIPVLSPANGSSASAQTLLANFIYISSNVPFAASYVFKEYAFQNLNINVIYLTQMVSIYQFFLCVALAPIQQMPGMGSENGMSLSDIWTSLGNGFTMFLTNSNAFWMLITYTLVNFVFNTTGLYLVKHGNALLNVFSFAIILPLTVLTFNLPLLGQYREDFSPSTLLGLAVVLIGFFLWRAQDLQPVREFESRVIPEGVKTAVYAFQERALLNIALPDRVCEDVSP